MTKEYNLLFSVTLQHAFYADESPSDMVLEPTRATHAFMRAYGVHARMEGDQLIVFYGKEQALAPALAYAPGKNALTFLLRSLSPFFFNRTEIPFFQAHEQRLYFTNIGKTPDADGRIKLSLGAYADGSDLLPMDASVFKPMSLPNNVLGCVEIMLGRESGLVQPPDHDPMAPPVEEQRFILNFQARAATWRYLVVNKSQLVFEQMEILDGRNPLVFRQGEPRMLRGTNHLAVPMSSASTYTIQERAALRPKLRLNPPAENGLQRKTPTVIDLPTPDGRRIVPEMVDGNQQVFADMYVFL